MFTPAWARAALTHPVFTGLSKQHLANLIVELADPWTAAHQAALHRRRGHPRRRGAGAGPHQRLVFADRVLVTLVILRYQLPHQALAVLYGVDRATITRAVGEVRPLLAERGFAVPGLPGVRLRTLADVFAYAAAHGIELRIDGTETQVRRPRANRPGRRAFVSGKRKQNTIRTTTIGDGRAGCTIRPRSKPRASRICCGSTRPSPPGWTPAIGAWPRPSPTRCAPHHPHRPRPRRPRRSPPSSRHANGSPRGGSASSTPSPSTSSGDPCSATSAAARPTPRRIWPSQGWSPTGLPVADHPSAGPIRPACPDSYRAPSR